jgi:hypothetical protein
MSIRFSIGAESDHMKEVPSRNYPNPVAESEHFTVISMEMEIILRGVVQMGR